MIDFAVVGKRREGLVPMVRKLRLHRTCLTRTPETFLVTSLKGLLYRVVMVTRVLYTRAILLSHYTIV